MVTSKDKAKVSMVQGSSKRMNITANTPFGVCEDRLTAYGGLLALLKVLDLIGFKEAFENHYVPPERRCELGDRGMLTGFLLLLFCH